MNEKNPFEIPGIPKEEMEQVREQGRKENEALEKELADMDMPPHGRSVKDLLEMDVNKEGK